MNDFKFTNKNPRFFYDTNNFPFLNPLTQNFKTIKGELLNLLEGDNKTHWLNAFPDYVASGNNTAWKTFSFVFFSMKLISNAKFCPKTAEIIFSIPEIISGEYSLMKPTTTIKPHKGFSRMVLRCHLPLLVNNSDLCGLRVGNETIHWKEGELIIFDDSFEHEAWNNSDKNRVVLMFDIPNPLWGYSAYEISKYKIENIDDSFLLNMASKEKWQESFDKKLFPLESFSE